MFLFRLVRLFVHVGVRSFFFLGLSYLKNVATEKELIAVLCCIVHFVGLRVLMDCAGGAYNSVQGLQHDFERWKS